MIFIAILLAALAVYLIQMLLYSRRVYDDLFYSVSLSAEEVFEGEDIFMYEELVNAKNLPIPALRVDTELPQGLQFRVNDPKDRTHRRDLFEQYMQSAFVMKGRQKIRRRWRINCQRRGVYRLDTALMVTNDLFGFNVSSKSFTAAHSRHNQVVVLPRAIDLEKHFTSSQYHSGEVMVFRSLISDPLLRSGTREYQPDDPMSRINWLSSAAHGRLMVNIEEFTQQHVFNIVLNMQSRSIEQHAETPSSPEYIEMCITVAASILDKMSADNVEVRMFVNTPPASVGMTALSDDEVGARLTVTEPFCGKRDTLTALRILASLKMEISCPFDRMLDHIIACPQYYANAGNIVVVSAYIDERMINFHAIMARQGVKVIFYVTTANQNAIAIPDDVEVFYRIHR